MTRLIASFGVDPPPRGLAEAETSEVVSLAELGSLRTVLLRVGGVESGRDAEYSVAELADVLEGPDGGDTRDQNSFQYFLRLSADPDYEPVLLLEPTPTGWWLIDGVHRAAGFFSARRATGQGEIRLPVFVLPRALA